MYNKLEISISKDFDSWEDFLQKEEAGNIFQSPVLIPAYSKTLKFDAYLLVARLNQEIIGGMLTYRRFPPRFSYLLNELYTSYGPIVAKDTTALVKDKIIGMLLRSVKNLVNINTIKHTLFVRADYIYKNAIPKSNINSFIFERAGYRKVQFGYGQTFVVNLESDTSSIIKRCEKRVRWSLNKAKRFNIRAHVENTPEGLEKFYKLYITTAKRHNSIITPFAFLRELYNILMPRKMIDIYIAYVDGVPASAAITLNHKNTAYYYMSASLEKLHYTQANTFLQFFIITYLKNKGIKNYDLLCAPASHDIDNPQYGLYIFKKGFGGEYVPVFHYEQIYNRVLYMAESKLLNIYKAFFQT